MKSQSAAFSVLKMSEQLSDLGALIRKFPDKINAANFKKGLITRPHAVILVWAYIRQEDLQDSEKRRMINCDAKLFGLSGKRKISMFEVGKILSQHLSK